MFQFDWEVKLMVWLQENIVNTPLMIEVGVIFTYFGEPLMGVLVIGALYWGIDKEFGEFVGINMLSTMVLNPMIKNVFFRIRPYFANESIKCLKAVDESHDVYDMAAQGYSFPSGHSMSATSLFISISVYLKKKAAYIISSFIIVMVAISRFALGVHYPTDVMVGIVVALLVVFLFTKLQKRFPKQKIMIVCAILFSTGFLYCKTDDYYQLYGMFLGFMISCFFEKKYVKFKNTKNIIRIVIRTILGGLIFLAVNKGLKLPFDESFLNSRTFLSNLYMLFRYVAGVIVAMAIYPMIFKYNILKFDDNKKY